MLKRIAAFLLVAALLICAPSCNAIDSIKDTLNGVLNSDANSIDSHDYMAEEYDFPEQIGDFKSIERSEYLCYNNLTDSQKQAYDYMYSSAMKMDKALFYVGECTTDDVTVAFHSLTYDCPYLIWLPSTYGVSEQANGTYVRFVDPDGEYSYTLSPEERDVHLDELYKEIDLFVSQNLHPTMSDYEVELAIHDWICEQTEYDQDAANAVKSNSEVENPNAWTPYGAIVQNRAVCAGYSKAMQMILNYVGIECSSLRVTSRGEMHMVCIVNLGGDWVYADPTWNDKEACGLPFTHDYFNLTYEEIKATHTVFDSWKDVLSRGEELDSNFNISVPNSYSNEYNYYKVNGLQINSEFDFKTKIITEFNYAVNQGINSLEFQITYCQPTNDTLKDLIDKYDVIDAFSRRGFNIKGLTYAALNNGAFCIKIDVDKDA